MGIYTYQNLRTLIGSKSGTTRTAVTLADAYDTSGTASTTFETGGMSKVNLSIVYTTGSGETSNTIELKVESSSDGTNWYQIVNEAVSTTTSTLYLREFTIAGVDNGTPMAFSLPLDTQDEYMRISFKETGKATNYGTVYCEVLISGDK